MFVSLFLKTAASILILLVVATVLDKLVRALGKSKSGDAK